MAFLGVNLACKRIPVSPISYGISWAITAIKVLIALPVSLENATPKAKPSKMLWSKSPIKLRFPAFLLM